MRKRHLFSYGFGSFGGVLVCCYLLKGTGFVTRCRCRQPGEQLCFVHNVGFLCRLFFVSWCAGGDASQATPGRQRPMPAPHGTGRTQPVGVCCDWACRPLIAHQANGLLNERLKVWNENNHAPGWSVGWYAPAFVPVGLQAGHESGRAGTTFGRGATRPTRGREGQRWQANILQRFGTRPVRYWPGAQSKVR